MAVDIIARGLAGSAGEQAEIAQRLVAEEYDPTHQYYNTNDIVVYDGKLYLCTNTNVTGTFNPAKWQQIVVSSELTEIINKLATITNPMLVKGRVDTVNDLPANAEPGWVYFVGAEGSTEFAEYVYTEDDEWQCIGVTQPIDTELSTTSTNPVQNRVITEALGDRLKSIAAAAEYDSSHTYITGEYMTLDGELYRCDPNGSEIAVGEDLITTYSSRIKNSTYGYRDNTAWSSYSGGTIEYNRAAFYIAGTIPVTSGKAYRIITPAYTPWRAGETAGCVFSSTANANDVQKFVSYSYGGASMVINTTSNASYLSLTIFKANEAQYKVYALSPQKFIKTTVADELAGKLDITSIDNALSTTSENPVQNKVVANALSDIDDTKYPKNWDVPVTMAEYEALPASKYSDGKNYYITDAVPDWEPMVIYGYHVDPDEADPSEAITYLEDAVGMTPAAMGTNSFNYGSWRNAFFMPKPCMVKYGGTVDYFLDENDYAYKADTTGTYTTIQGGYNNVIGSFYSIQNDSDANYGFNCRIDNVFPAEKDARYIVKCDDNTLTASVWFLDAYDKCIGNVSGTMPLKFKSTISGTAKMVLSFTIDGATAVAPSDVGTVKIGEASDIDDATYDGNAMMQWPLIYWKYEAGTADGEGYFYCSNKKVDDSYHCWCNYDANDNITDHFYTAIYNGVILDGKMRSLSGYALTSANGNGGTTGAQEATAATANNTNSTIEWYISVWSDYMLVAGLTILVGKSLNVQNTFGQGISIGSQAAKESYVTGTANDKGLFYGDITGTSTVVKVFGMENWWACCWRRTAGLVGGSTNYLYKLTYGKADGSTIVGYNSTGSGYLIGSTRCTSSNYVKACDYGKQGFIAKTVGSPASASAYYCDYYYAGTGFALVGGSSTAGSYDGFSLNLNVAFATASWNIAAALSFKPLA